MNRITTLLLWVLLAFFACKSQKPAIASKMEFWVNSYKVPCEGVAPMDCLQIKRSEEGSWQNFYGHINGFEYRPGFRYKIRVKEKKLHKDQVPADASSKKYTLVSILEKTLDKTLFLNDIWVLKKH